MEAIEVHPRIMERHPEISDDDVIAAWANCIRSVPRLDRQPNEYIAIGADGKGRLLELIAIVSDGIVLIYHAFTPPTDKAMRELGFKGGF